MEFPGRPVKVLTYCQSPLSFFLSFFIVNATGTNKISHKTPV